MLKKAVISPCGAYRYILWRKWDIRGLTLPIIMLNPSTADADIDDPTIRRCMAFASRDGYGGIVVANLFAFRSTTPLRMPAVGPDNAKHIQEIFEYAAQWRTPILAAWGAYGHDTQAETDVMIESDRWSVDLVCLGTTSAGAPRHPLYVRSDAPMTLWAGRDR